MTADPIIVPNFLSATFGMVVFLVGAMVTRHVRVLRDYNIPEPVSGGVIAALVTLAIYHVFGRTVEFQLYIRDYLLLVFFAGIGLNARLADLKTGGRPLLILLGLTVAFIFCQNLVGVLSAWGFGLPPQVGILLGSASLIGGHGTAIAWSPAIAERTGFAGALELGIAAATIGLVAAALVGGPIAKLLIETRDLAPERPEEHSTLGLMFEDEEAEKVTHHDFMRVLLVLHVVVICGFFLNAGIGALGLKLPLFVPAMLVAIAIGNLIPVALPRLPPVSRSAALSLISELSLGVFLAMSLMSMQLWTLEGMGLMLTVTMALQTLMAIAFILFLVFRLMGGEYRAAVLSAGFAGFSLGATPTAIANMNAVTKRYGPSPVAFVILPLISAFFVDLANAAVIQMFLAL